MMAAQEQALIRRSIQAGVHHPTLPLRESHTIRACVSHLGCDTQARTANTRRYNQVDGLAGTVDRDFSKSGGEQTSLGRVGLPDSGS